MPFTHEEFLSVFSNYNIQVWPMQLVLVLSAAFSVLIIFTRINNRDRIVSGILVFLWIWMGIVYHLIFFSSINKAAYFFGIIFVFQGLMFLYHGVIKNKLKFLFLKRSSGITGILFIFFALVIYPILGHLFGHVYPKTPTFGAPCPTVIFTFGLLLTNNHQTPIFLLIIPLIWSLIGFSAAVNLQITEDFGLFIVGIIGSTLILINNAKKEKLLKHLNT